MSNLQSLVMRLQRVATKNKDRFAYRIHLVPCGNSIRYRFICEETADNHTFLEGDGNNIDEAVENAEADIQNACASWGYCE
jgi:hypothetical protein